MKWNMILLAGALFSAFYVKAEEDSLGVIGDDLDLYAVLNAFKISDDIESFEKAINDPEAKISNLDLDENGEVDYLKVIDNSEGDVHALVIQVDVSETESQDVAVIELEKTGDENVTVQIVGDEDLYGADYIVEPLTDVVNVKSLHGATGLVINVWIWPSVRFIYGPKYVRWVSPWKFRSHPVWFKPWKPTTWRVYHTHNHRHHAYFHRATVRRCATAHALYRRHRVVSARVHHHPRYRGAQGHPHHTGGGREEMSVTVIDTDL